MTEDEMVGWHHRLGGHEFEQAPGVGDGQGSLACCSPWENIDPVGVIEQYLVLKLRGNLFVSLGQLNVF